MKEPVDLNGNPLDIKKRRYNTDDMTTMLILGILSGTLIGGILVYILYLFKGVI